MTSVLANTAVMMILGLLLAGPASAATLLHAQARLADSMERNGPARGFVPYLTADVAYLHPGEEIIIGREATTAFLRTIYGTAEVHTSLHTLASGTSQDGRMGYTFGWLEERGAPGEPLDYGRFIAVWSKREGGWQVRGFLRIESSRPPSPPPADALILDGAPGLPQPGLVAAHRLAITTADSQFADLSIAEGYPPAFVAYAADAAVLLNAGDSLWNREGFPPGSERQTQR